jgi:hypothetical protein
LTQPTLEISENLPLTEFQKAVKSEFKKARPHEIAYRGGGALSHLAKSWDLLPIDMEMSAFRAITAEEEAATALILALKHRQYPGAQKLNHTRHQHKAAFIPFIDALKPTFAACQKQIGTMTLALNEKSIKPTIELRVDVSELLGIKQYLLPDQPLNFTIGKADNLDADFSDWSKFSVHDFENELEDLATGAGKQNITEHINSEANLRNQLLYANTDGIPKIELTEPFLCERLRRVMILLALSIIILQTPQKQLFAVQCLEALLKALGLDRNVRAFDFEAAQNTSNTRLVVHKKQDKAPTLLVTRKYKGASAVKFHLSPVWRA